MARKDDYGLPDETLQLIAAAPSIFAGNKYLEPRYNINSRLPGSELIAALRASGTDNNGFTQYANAANADSASARTARRGLFAPAKLTIPRVSREITLPTAEPQTPVTRTPQVMGPLPVNPDLDPDPVDPIDPVDPVDPVKPDPVAPTPSIYTTPIVTDIPDETDPDTIPLIPAPDILETVPSIYTKPIATDIPDEVDPSTIPWIIPEFPLDLPEIPEVPDRTGIVEMYPGDAVIPEVVGPRKGGGGDLPEDFDKYLVEIMNSLNGGGGAVGGGKPADDTYGNILEM